MAVDLEELRRGQRKLNQAVHEADNEEVNRLALKVCGALSEASTQQIRRRALEKARRMLGRR
jgi:hypothetical protein